jgi:hypothetical protein
MDPSPPLVSVGADVGVSSEAPQEGQNRLPSGIPPEHDGQRIVPIA